MIFVIKSFTANYIKIRHKFSSNVEIKSICEVPMTGSESHSILSKNTEIEVNPDSNYYKI